MGLVVPLKITMISLLALEIAQNANMPVYSKLKFSVICSLGSIHVNKLSMQRSMVGHVSLVLLY